LPASFFGLDRRDSPLNERGQSVFCPLSRRSDGAKSRNLFLKIAGQLKIGFEEGQKFVGYRPQACPRLSWAENPLTLLRTFR
jgi:hypothetical protein